MVVMQCVGAAFAFAAVWIATKYLGADGYGEIAAIIAAAQIVQIFTAWTAIALSRYGTEEFVVTGRITQSFWARFFILLPNTLVILALSFLWLPQLSSWLKLQPGSGWLVLGFFVAISVWMHVQHSLLGAKLPRVNSTLLAVERAITVILMLVLVWFGRLDPATAVGAYILSQFFVSAVGLIMLRGLVSWKFELDVDALKKILKFSYPLFFAFFVLNLSNSYIDAIFISQYLTKADLGIYSIAYQFNGMFLQFPLLAGSLLGTLFVTLRTNNGFEKVRTYMQDVLPVLTAAAGLGIMVIVLVSGIFIGFAFGENGPQITSILTILALSTVFAAPCMFGYMPFFNSLSASYFWTIYTAVAAGINIVGDIFLIPRYGLLGSALATVLGQALAFVVIVILVNRKYDLKHRWTVQATVPAVAGVWIAYWSGNMFYGLGGVILLTGLLILVYRKIFTRGVRMLINYKSTIALQ